ncbi:MAG: PrgI family protein [Candidatus Saccharibacteria bacterium]
MAVYKVIQDIEAEDKLLGPLTLKQFVFAGVSCGFLFAAFMIATRISIYGAIPLLPFIIVPAILAAPFGKDQPTDVWLAALIRFWFKPHKRLWDQNDVKHLVTITAPIKVDKYYSDNLSQGQVRSRLKVLSDTIDSRGWAAQNASYATAYTQSYGVVDDRLVNPYTATVTAVPEDIATNSPDIMDPTDNPLAQKFDTMTRQAEQANKSAAINRMNATTQYSSQQTDQDYYFMRQPDPNQVQPGSAMFSSAVIKPTGYNSDDTMQASQYDNSNDQELLAQIKSQKQQALQQSEMTTTHHKLIKTPDQLAQEQKNASLNAIEIDKSQKNSQKTEQAQAVTPPINTDIVNLSQDNDLSVATIAGLANRKTKNTNMEGEIKLH